MGRDRVNNLRQRFAGIRLADEVVREIGLLSEARRFAGECLELAERLPANTLDDVVSTKTSVGGVPLPEHFHDGVVRSRLADLLVAA